MNYSHDGQLLTQSFESCRLVAYLDGRGKLTIGWGHTFGVKLGDTCTQAQADSWLLDDVQTAVLAVSHYVTVDLTQHEFDALVDFVFNVGQGNFMHSTMLAKLNASDIAGAADEFEKWDMSAGQHVAGLLRRRVAEKTEFLTP